MIPQRIEGATRIIGSRNGIAIIDQETPEGGNAMTSVWELTPDDVKALHHSGKLYVTIYANAHPPISLMIAT